MRMGPMVAVVALVHGAALQAQTCTCSTAKPLGSCTEKKATYPDLFPGAVVVTPPLGGRPSYLYVADLYSGTTYRYESEKFETNKNPTKIISPGGALATTGLAYRAVADGITLLWAVNDGIYATDLDGNNARLLGTAKLDLLADELRGVTGDASIQPGMLGGITNHASTGVLWGVDIVNDVYFALQDNGDLVLEGGKPVFFLSPVRSALGGAAFGNSIAYVASGGGEYFDIPVGGNGDGKPVEVRRVHATAEAEAGVEVGMETGITYSLTSAAVGAPKFVSGIAFWPESCGAGQASEILLDMDDFGGSPRILQIAGDQPTAATVTDFACEEVEPTIVRISWRKTLPYTVLAIIRQRLDVPGAAEVTVFQGTNPADDPSEFLDQGIIDGTYEYRAEVTAAEEVGTPRCKLVTGFGTVTKARRFALPSYSEAGPYALTLIDGLEGQAAPELLVVDLQRGDAEVLDLDLTLLRSLQGPVQDGLTTGIAFNQDNKLLYWLENRRGAYYLHTTDPAGVSQGAAVPVESPVGLPNGTLLGDLSYNTEKNYFLVTDLRSSTIYGITALGRVEETFAAKQLPAPIKGGPLSGGISSVSAAGDLIVSDIVTGPASAELTDRVVRAEHNTKTFADARIIDSMDVRTATGATEFGSTLAYESEALKAQYVVGLDTRYVYRLTREKNSDKFPSFKRGDANGDGNVNISDPSALLSHLFKGGPALGCELAADTDGSGALDLADAIALFNYLFRAGPPPAAPFPNCGLDIQSTLSCGNSPCQSS